MSDLTIRDATADDLPAIIALLAQDQMGGENDSPGPPLARAPGDASRLYARTIV